MNNLLINHINTMLGNARSKGQKVDYISFCPQDYKEVASALSFNFSPDESTSGEGMLFGYRFVIRDGASGLKMKNGEFWALPIVVKELGDVPRIGQQFLFDGAIFRVTGIQTSLAGSYIVNGERSGMTDLVTGIAWANCEVVNE